MEEVGPRAWGATRVDEIAYVDIAHSNNAVERSIDLLEGLQRLELLYIRVIGLDDGVVGIVCAGGVVDILLRNCIALQQLLVAILGDLREPEIGLCCGEVAA